MSQPVPSNILAEHQGVPSSPAPGYNPSESEENTIRMVERLFSEGKKAKESLDRKNVENYKFFRGKQWPQRRPSYRTSEVLNFIFSEVQSVLVIMTDSRPNIEILPEDPTDYEFAEIINQVLNSKWDANNWSYVVAEAIVDAAIYGTAIGSVLWKPELEQGLGDFSFESEDVFYFYPDPKAKSKVNDEYCDWVILAKPQDLAKLKARYPDKADFLKPDLADLTNAYQDHETAADDVRYKSPTDNRVLIESDRSVKSFKPNQILEICLYMKSEEMIDEEVEGEEDPQTGLKTKLYQSKKKYPNGRKVVVANGVLLEDGPNPYEDGKFPFARLVDHILPREFWGVGEVEQLKSPQRIVNSIVSHILDYMKIMGNPIWIVDDTARVDTDNLTNQDGLVVEKTKGSEVRRESGVTIPPHFMDMLDYMSERIMNKLGSTGEISKGVAPSDNSSGYAIAQLQEAAQTKLRGKSRNLEVFLKEIGDLKVSRILQFYTTPRIIRLTSNQESAKYFKFAISEQVDESGEVQKIAAVQEYGVDDMGNEVWGPVKEVPLKSRLDVKISVGSSLPFAKIENRTMAEKLFDKGIIDAEEYLTQIEYPHKERVLQRLRNMPPPLPPGQGAPNAGSNAPASAPPAV